MKTSGHYMLAVLSTTQLILMLLFLAGVDRQMALIASFVGVR